MLVGGVGFVFFGFDFVVFYSVFVFGVFFLSFVLCFFLWFLLISFSVVTLDLFLCGFSSEQMFVWLKMNEPFWCFDFR